jgi:hypothetical protein
MELELRQGVLDRCDEQHGYLSSIVDKNVESRKLFPNVGREGIDGARVFNVELHAAHAGGGAAVISLRC